MSRKGVKCMRVNHVKLVWLSALRASELDELDELYVNDAFARSRNRLGVSDSATC